MGIYKKKVSDSGVRKFEGLWPPQRTLGLIGEEFTYLYAEDENVSTGKGESMRVIIRQAIEDGLFKYEEKGAVPVRVSYTHTFEIDGYNGDFKAYFEKNTRDGFLFFKDVVIPLNTILLIEFKEVEGEEK